MSKKEKVIDELIQAQKIFNVLLIQARNVELRVDLSINKTDCFVGDEAYAIGLNIHSFIVKQEYHNDGVP